MTSAPGPLGRAWDRFWFAPADARNLAAARIAFAVQALWVLLSRDLAATSGLPRAFWSTVEGGTQWRYLLFPGHLSLESALQLGAVAALVLVLFGWHARPAALGAALLLYHLAPLEAIIWTPNPYERGFEIATLGLVVLAASPCDDAWSLRARGRPTPAPAERYRWPLMLLWLFVAQPYVIAGWSKLYRVGWEWATAENLQRWMLLFSQVDQIRVFDGVAAWVAARPLVCGAVAVTAIGLDLGFVAVLFWRGARLVLVPLAVLFHAGILVTMNIAWLNAPQLLVYVDWAALAGRRQRSVTPHAERPDPGGETEQPPQQEVLPIG